MEKTQEDWIAEAQVLGKQMFSEFLDVLKVEIDKAVNTESTVTLCLTQQDDPTLILPFQQATLSPLTDIANVLRPVARGIMISWGYEKLALIVPNMQPLDAAPMMRRALEAVSNHHFDGGKEYLTLSVGMASFPEHGLLAEELTVSALDALEAAQAAGGNCVVIAKGPASCEV